MAVAPEAEVESGRREDRGAEGAEGSRVCGGGPPSPENFSIFELKKAFRCILGAIFCS